MQNIADSRILHFSTPQTNMDNPLHDITIKVHKYAKYAIKVQILLRKIPLPYPH